MLAFRAHAHTETAHSIIPRRELAAVGLKGRLIVATHPMASALPLANEGERLMLPPLLYRCVRGVTVAALAIAIAGCGPSETIDHPTVNGQRVQATDVVANAAPIRMAAYELIFSDASDTDVQARRAALLVEFVGGDGQARGFVEWGKPGEAPSTYLANGWVRQRRSIAAPVTVFDLALHYIDVPGAQGAISIRARPTPLAVRVLVDETTGHATLTRRR